jgi:hypothetical protein
VFHALLRPRTGSILTSGVIAGLAWLQADVSGVDRVAIVLAALLFTYVVFNATAALVQRVGSVATD